MSVEDKFRAAVNVIRSLPKNGSYQPSHDLMLRFYAYYKQATEGPNRGSKPAFWEVIKKAKWEAWARLGNMTKDEAMTAYVEELNKIVETMAYTDNVADFLISLDSFYSSVPAEDLEMCIGPALDRVRVPPESRESSPTLGTPPDQQDNEDDDEEDEDEEDFLDTLEQAEPEKHEARIEVRGRLGSCPQLPNGKIDISMESSLEKALENVRSDMMLINQRLNKYEEKYKNLWRRRSSRFGGLPRQTVIFFLLWPVLVNLGFFWLYRRRRMA